MEILVPRQELWIPLLCLGLFLLVFFPRLRGLMETTMLEQLTELTGPLTDVNPKPVYSRQNYLEGAKSVQRALAHNYKATNWSIKVVQVEDPIEKAIRVIGTSILGPALVHTPTTIQSDPKAPTKTMAMTIHVDVHQVTDGCRIVWKYIPEDASEFQRRVQLNDRNLRLLLGRTNYSIIKQLHAKKFLN